MKGSTLFSLLACVVLVLVVYAVFNGASDVAGWGLILAGVFWLGSYLDGVDERVRRIEHMMEEDS